MPGEHVASWTCHSLPVRLWVFVATLSEIAKSNSTRTGPEHESGNLPLMLYRPPYQEHGGRSACFVSLNKHGPGML